MSSEISGLCEIDRLSSQSDRGLPKDTGKTRAFDDFENWETLRRLKQWDLCVLELFAKVGVLLSINEF